jgi:hypothetical protein
VVGVFIVRGSGAHHDDSLDPIVRINIVGGARGKDIRYYYCYILMMCRSLKNCYHSLDISNFFLAIYPEIYTPSPRPLIRSLS